MRRSVAKTVLCALLACPAGLCKDVTIHGFVTAVNSPTSFEIDNYRVTRDKTVTLDLNQQQADKPLATFRPEDIRVGTELEINGEYDESSGELKAGSIKVFSYDTLSIKRTALLEKMPSLTKDDSGWTGVVYADGQRISVSPATVVCLKPNHAERMSLRNDGQSETMKFTPDSLNLDTFVHYEGTRESDGSVRAEKMEFQHAEVEKSEVILWRRYYPRVREPDYDAFRSGELRLHWKNYKIVPNREAQEFIAQLGNSLIPAHQKSLADGDPLKIPFRFFLVEDKSFNAVTYPNGVVVVHSGVFDVLENEAQLAFVLSHEISHAVEKHAWQQNEYYKTELIALRVAGVAAPEGLLVGNLLASGISSQYSRSLESQADRVGLEWMLKAGYDIRQAPESWQAVSNAKGDSPANPFWASHDNATTRRSYLMAELRNNYSGLDYSNLREDSDEFHRVADLVKQFENAKKTTRVKAGE